MKILTNTKRTRFKLTAYVVSYACLLLPLCIYKEQEGIAGALIGLVTTIISLYHYGETKRPSENK